MIRKSLFLIFMLTIVFFLKSFSAITNGTNMDSSGCRKCHEEIFKKVETSPYRHAAALSGCEVCHVESEQDIEDNKREERSLSIPIPLEDFVVPVGTLEKEKQYQVEVVLTDADEKQSDPYVVNLNVEKIKDYTHKFRRLKNIKDVHLEEIEPGLFVRATIAWHTDAPSTSKVEYRLAESKGNGHYTVEYDEVYTWDHRIELNKLGHNKKYIYKVISKDLFGTEVQSGEYKIETDRKKETDNGNESLDEIPLVEKVEFFRLKGKKGIYMRVKTNKPSYCAVTFYAVEQKQEKPSYVHNFTIDRYTTIDACNNCHSFTVSHPVGMRPSGDHVRIPEDLPTIEDGIITCVSCHDPHGSSRMYLARVDFKEDLCLKCHDDTIYDR